ncbi:hypothetical protein [Cellulomonas triticagri]|uniref:Uncharacterized protein n=1 Tax=Cellulomonas triticagri TaxID=2483352 RepID=A0A3M2JMQ6_9CELL|nr:hypothetical protein [Cellulomonas triticagri]RMI13090.1 hypothetical protein EBM89_05825 [Cellulomonas triticagri]
MTDDVRSAVSVGILLFAGLLALVTTGAATIPPREATDLRIRRWRWAPVVLLTAGVLTAVLLPWWPSLPLSLAAAALAGAALLARTQFDLRESGSSRRVAARNSRPVRRVMLVYASLLVLAVGVCAGVVVTQG